jgi:signal transduction histidine kinase
LLPPGSEVLFQPLSPWKLYRNWIIAIVLLNAALAGLAVLWAIQRSRARRQAVTNFELSKRLITAYEDERRLIARELHDDVSQSLTRLSIDASLIHPEANLRQSEEKLLQLQDDIARVSRDVHELSYRLHPSMVEDLGLVNALRAECSLMQRHTEALVHVDIQEGQSSLPLPIRLNIYRIGQEALQNAIRHSGASRIDVELHFDEREVALVVGDNGCGFDAGSRSTTFSLGLASMRERARLAGATLRIDSKPGQGTRVQLSVPARELPE